MPRFKSVNDLSKRDGWPRDRLPKSSKRISQFCSARRKLVNALTRRWRFGACGVQIVQSSTFTFGVFARMAPCAPHPARCLATRREGLVFRDVYQRVCSGFCGVHGVGNLLHHRTHQAPCFC
jgi:hypothetical protein